MKDLHENSSNKIDVVLLVGDIVAYTDFNIIYNGIPFLIFSMTFSIFAEVPLMVANGNHGT
jgi:hypothetical protein